MAHFKNSLAVAAALFAGQVSAGTVLGFDGLLDGTEYFSKPAYTESGFTLSTTYGAHTASDMLARLASEAVHLEVCCGPFSSTMFVQKNDFSAFSATSFDVLGDPTQTFYYDLANLNGVATTEVVSLPIQIEASGYLSGAVVATEMFSASVTTFDLSSAFGAIDALQLTVSGADTSALPQNAQWDLSDVHLDIDNVALGEASLTATPLAEMPIPAGAVLLLSALGGVVLTRRRKA